MHKRDRLRGEQKTDSGFNTWVTYACAIKGINGTFDGNLLCKLSEGNDRETLIGIIPNFCAVKVIYTFHYF